MTFAEVLTYLKSIPSKDVFQLINDLEGGLIYVADKWKISSMIFFVAGIVLSVIIGLAAFKLIKPTLIVANGFFGIMAGSALFYALCPKLTWMPDWLCYIFCILVAALFICLTAAKPAGSLVFYAGLLGYFIMSFYLPSRMVALAVAFLFALIAYLLPRTAYICGTSFAGALLSVGFLSMILPNVKELQLGGGWTSIVIALVIAVAFILVQFGSNRYHGEEI